MKTLTKQQWVGVGLLLLLVVAVEVFVQVALPQLATVNPEDSEENALLSTADSLLQKDGRSAYRRDTIWI